MRAHNEREQQLHQFAGFLTGQPNQNPHLDWSHSGVALSTCRFTLNCNAQSSLPGARQTIL
eukprot:5508482-Amphidinium_carterae.1